MNKGGRPLKFKSVADLQQKIDAYFANCDPHMEEVTEWVEARDSSGKLKKDSNGLNYLVEVTHKVMTEQQPYTISGLAVWLGTDRGTIVNYAGRKGYSDSIKDAKARCEAFAEHMLNVSPNPTGTIFNLKNNYGWKDKQEIDQNTTGEQIVKIIKYTDDDDNE